MGTRAKKIEYDPGEFEAALVAPALSVDPARTHLHTPFGSEFQGVGWVCGTDGHRAHVTQTEAWHKYARRDAPPVAQVIPWGARWRGEIVVSGLDDARCFPAKWDVKLEVQPKVVLARCSVRGNSRQGTLYPFGRDGLRVEWFRPLEQLTYSFEIQLDYLLDAVDFVGSQIVQVWSDDASPKNLGLQPICFTAGAKSVAEAKRIAVVMPFRL